MSQQPPSTQITVAVSITAAFIALSGFGLNIQNLVKPENSYDVLLEYNYKVLKENVKDENVALLKGLIMLKSKHPELSLKQVLEFPITKDKLFELLYM
jgi:predicted metal-dependent peptidase